MKNLSVIRNLIFLAISVCLVACGVNKSDIQVKNNEIVLSALGIKINAIVPVINNEKQVLKNIDYSDSVATAHYAGSNDVKNFDLIFTKVVSDSVINYQLSVKFLNKTEWLAADTLRILLNTSDSIKAGIYSILYEPMYCWTKPMNFTSFATLGKQTGIEFAYWQFSNNVYAATLPMGGNGFSFNLENTQNGFGAVGTTACIDTIEGEVPVLAISLSSNFYKLVPAIYQTSFTTMGMPDNLRINKAKPDMYNYLGWASWNSFMFTVTADKIVEMAQSLSKEKIPVKWMLIDDGWLDATDSKLNSFNPNKEKFPNGFKPLVSKLKTDFGIANVGIWHALNGYWQGISDSGEIAKNFKNQVNYKDYIVWLTKEPVSLHFVNPMSADGFRFYNEWYQSLTSQGISFIKVDNQLVAKKIAHNNIPSWNASEKMFDNLHSAVIKHFNGNIINCMSMINNDFFHYKKTAIARTSEDYNPKGDSKLYKCTFMGNAAAHILACVHNSVWLQNIVWPDYDMFQSSDKDAWYYAIAKVISSGPIYITDEPKKHNASLLKSLTFSDGQIINADKPALPTEDCIFQIFDLDKPLKVFSTYQNIGLLAAWNVSDKDSVCGSFSPSMINGLMGEQFVVFDFFNKTLTKVTALQKLPITLKRTGCDFYSIAPYMQQCAVIGDTSKIIPMAAVSNITYAEKSVSMSVKEKSTIWIYSERKPSNVLLNNKSVNAYSYKNNIISVCITEAKSILELQFQ